MYLLKCNKCGHLNELKTQYLTFCTGCNKKLDNNFREWQASNIDKSFADYQKMVCVTSESLWVNNNNIGKGKNKNRTKKIVLIIVGAVVALGILLGVVGYFLAPMVKDKVLSYIGVGKTSEEVLTAAWVTNELPNGFSVETPQKLNPMDMQLAPQIMQLIDKKENYGYMSEKGFKISANYFRYRPELAGKISIEGVALGSIYELKSQKGVSDLVYNDEGYTKLGIPGFIQRGSCQFFKIPFEFINVGINKELDLWNVIVFYAKGDDVGKKAAERVVNSINLKK